MSIRVISTVWASSRQAGNDLLVLLALADYADDRGVAFPAVPTLAEKCRMSPRNANRVIAALRESGELIIEANAGPRGANIYRICPPSTPDGIVSPDGIATLTELSAPPDSSVPIPLTVPSDEPSVNREQPSRAAGKPAPGNVERSDRVKGSRLAADWVLPKAWGEWAMSEAPGWSAEQVRKTAERFKDYWIAKPGREGVKADWLATWRNWVRREAERTTSAAPATAASASNLFRGAI